MSAKRKFVIALNVLAVVIFLTDLTATRLLASEHLLSAEPLVLAPLSAGQPLWDTACSHQACLRHPTQQR